MELCTLLVGQHLAHAEAGGVPGGENAGQGSQDDDDGQPKECAFGGKGVIERCFQEGRADGIAEEFANGQQH